MLKSYITKLYEIASRGDAREESYYFALGVLLKEYAESQDKRNIHITALPKNTEAGNPDFRVWDGKQHIVGYIEAKEPKVEFLDKVEGSEQLKRYRHTFPNLLLTNFFEFRLYRNGEFIERVQIGRPLLFQKVKAIQPVENEEQLLKLLEKFFSFSLPKTYNAKSLAVELAKRTRFLKDVVNEEMNVAAQESDQTEKPQVSPLQGFYDAFHKHLIAGLSKEEFADL